MFSPARGFYVVLPAEYRSWRATPALWFIDAMMAHLGRRYYVGFLSAAELWGATHQRPQTFQVAVDRPLAPRRIGRVSLSFHTSTRLDTAATVDMNTPTGTAVVATPAARPVLAGGLDNVATVVADLSAEGHLDPAVLARVATAYPASAVRRVGWLLSHHTDIDAVANLRPGLAAPTPLDPHGGRRGPIDVTWHVIVNAEPVPEG